MAFGEPVHPDIRGASVWKYGSDPVPLDDHDVGAGAVIWIDLLSGASPDSLFALLGSRCSGLSRQMLAELLTPDERPEGRSYDGGRIKLASTFSVSARRGDERAERGSPQRAGVLTFQPVEILASSDWVLTCWHPTRTFVGADRGPEGKPQDATPLLTELAGQWRSLSEPSGGDLGLLMMRSLALSYRQAAWRLTSWHQDWELGLYVDERLDNPMELPNLWGMMAVLRDWLNPLNRPSLREDPSRAWLPCGDHGRVVEIDERIDKTLSQLGKLAAEMRLSFQVLHVQQVEEARERKEHTQHLAALAAAIFLVPTLVVGFYGANTWLPGQGRLWGFYVMLGILLVLTLVSVGTVVFWKRQEEAEEDRLRSERDQARAELLRAALEDPAQADSQGSDAAKDKIEDVW